jgi:hypothetical protein
MVYLVGLLNVAHLKVEAAGGGQQGAFFSQWFTLSAFLMLPI